MRLGMSPVPFEPDSKRRVVRQCSLTTDPQCRHPPPELPGAPLSHSGHDARSRYLALTVRSIQHSKLIIQHCLCFPLPTPHKTVPFRAHS